MKLDEYDPSRPEYKHRSILTPIFNWAIIRGVTWFALWWIFLIGVVAFYGLWDTLFGYPPDVAFWTFTIVWGIVILVAYVKFQSYRRNRLR